MFKRCYAQGVGIGFTKEECEDMFNDIKLDDHIMTVVSGAGATTDSGDGGSDAVESSDSSDGGSDAVESSAMVAAGVLVGDCVDVYWEEDDQWFPAVVGDQRPDTDSTIASNCLYDGDSSKKWWHNLESTSYRRIAPDKVRLAKLSMKNLRDRLKREQVEFTSTDRKPALVELLFDKLSEVTPTLTLPLVQTLTLTLTQSRADV